MIIVVWSIIESNLISHKNSMALQFEMLQLKQILLSTLLTWLHIQENLATVGFRDERKDWK